MDSALLLTILMFGSLILLVMLGVSVSFALGAIGTITAFILYGAGGLFSIITGVFKYMWMLVLVAVPLFVFMGVALSHSKIASDMYEAFYLCFGRLRGGLAIGSCCFAAALSAMTGNCSASTLTAGLVGIPPMQKRGYKDTLIFGTIASAGSLGIVIPPSITLIIIGMMTGQSIGKLFAGGFVAGIVILFFFILYIGIRAWINPTLCPAKEEPVPLIVKLKALKSVALPVFIIIATLGSLFLGIATPTEAASVGALAVIISIGIRGELSWTFIKEVAYETAVITGMVMWIMFGAAGFVAVYTGSGGIYFVHQLLLSLNVSPWFILLFSQFIILILGMFLDPVGIIILTLPIFYPVISKLGFDPIWYGVIFNLALCIGYITPPFGYNLFYLKSISPQTPIKKIYVSVVPYIVIMVSVMIILMCFPGIIKWIYT